jgi:hypothetical protein
VGRELDAGLTLVSHIDDPPSVPIGGARGYRWVAIDGDGGMRFGGF